GRRGRPERRRPVRPRGGRLGAGAPRLAARPPRPGRGGLAGDVEEGRAGAVRQPRAGARPAGGLRLDRRDPSAPGRRAVAPAGEPAAHGGVGEELPRPRGAARRRGAAAPRRRGVRGAREGHGRLGGDRRRRRARRAAGPHRGPGRPPAGRGDLPRLPALGAPQRPALDRGGAHGADPGRPDRPDRRGRAGRRPGAEQRL
ncbi:MAG: hypothetical protein AVDCRST_MAG35-1977, partial [uncultured Quadrisphaera sp.]